MTQQIINLGSGPDTQTGDSLYVAFTKVNDNFTELYSVFDGNGISNINANVIISNNVVVSSNIRTGNLAAYGNIEAIGYIITAGAFYPNGIPIGSLGSIESNILPLTTNLYTIGSQTLQFSQGYFGTNISLAGANVTVIDGLLYVNGVPAGNFSNSNVAAYLPVYGGNLAATVTTSQQPYITQTGTLNNLTANVARIYGNLVVDGNLTVDGNVTFFNVDNLLVEDPIITLNTGPNGSPLSSNNGFDSGVQTYYYDTENRKSFFGRKHETGYFEYYSNVVTDVGNIVSGTYGTIKTGNLKLTQEANIAGNVSANYFLGNGRFLSGIDTTLISNGDSNVKVFPSGNISISANGVANVAEFTTQGGNISGDLFITGTIKALNYIGNVSGNLSAPGQDTQVIFNDNSIAGATSGFTFNKTSNVVTVAGNIESKNNILVNGITVIDSQANIVTARLQDSGVVSGTYGNASAVAVVTVDQKGRVTSISTTAVAGVNNLTYDTAVSNLTIYTSAGTTFSVDLGVGSSDSPVFANANITNTLFTNNLDISSFVTGNLIPSSNIAYNLGSNVARWRDLYLSGSSIYLDDLVLSANTSGLTISGNITSNGITANGSGIFESTLQAKGGLQNTVIGNITPTTAQFTTASTSGNLTAAAITANGSVTAGSTLSAAGGIQNTPIGNVIASTGQFTTVSATGNITGAALTSNSSITSATTLSAAGGIQNTPIGNVTPSTAQFTTASASGNITASGLTANNSITAGTTLRAAGGIQNTVIGNVTPTTAQFTTVSTNGNITTAALTANGSLTTGTTLQALGGIQNTIIGNVTPATAQFTTVSASGNVTAAALTANGSLTTGTTLQALGGIQNTTIGNLTPTTAQFTSVSTSGNLTTSGLTVNSSITAGSTLRVSGGIQNTIIGNVTPAGAQFTTINTSGNTTASGLTVNVDATVGGNLGVTNTVTTANLNVTNSLSTSQISITGGIQNTPIGNATPSTGNFTTLNSTGNTTVSALTVNNSATVGSSLGVAGVLTVTNTTPSTSNVTGAVRVSGGLGVAGNVYVGQRVGFVAANSVSAVYQIYNPTTNSLDTIFG